MYVTVCAEGWGTRFTKALMQQGCAVENTPQRGEFKTLLWLLMDSNALAAPRAIKFPEETELSSETFQRGRIRSKVSGQKAARLRVTAER